MKSRSLGAIAVLFSLAAMGCTKPIYVEYEEATRSTRPVFEAGDTVIFKTKVAWRANRSPCERDETTVEGFTKCKIKNNLTKRLFAYRCTDVYCDPEVAVDEDPGRPLIGPGGGPSVAPAGAVTLTQLTDEYLYLYCDGSTIKVDPGNHKDAIGTIEWRSLDDGQGGDEVKDWTVTLASAVLCAEGETAVTNGKQCTVQKIAPVNYTITATGGCTTAGSGVVTPKL